jgi:hypothetical protein
MQILAQLLANNGASAQWEKNSINTQSQAKQAMNAQTRWNGMGKLRRLRFHANWNMKAEFWIDACMSHRERAAGLLLFAESAEPGESQSSRHGWRTIKFNGDICVRPDTFATANTFVHYSHRVSARVGERMGFWQKETAQACGELSAKSGTAQCSQPGKGEGCIMNERHRLKCSVWNAHKIAPGC